MSGLVINGNVVHGLAIAGQAFKSFSSSLPIIKYEDYEANNVNRQSGFYSFQISFDKSHFESADAKSKYYFAIIQTFPNSDDEAAETYLTSSFDLSIGSNNTKLDLFDVNTTGNPQITSVSVSVNSSGSLNFNLWQQTDRIVVNLCSISIVGE